MHKCIGEVLLHLQERIVGRNWLSLVSDFGGKLTHFRAEGVIAGFGTEGYALALRRMCSLLNR